MWLGVDLLNWELSSRSVFNESLVNDGWILDFNLRFSRLGCRCFVHLLLVWLIYSLDLCYMVHAWLSLKFVTLERQIRSMSLLIWVRGLSTHRLKLLSIYLSNQVSVMWYLAHAILTLFHLDRLCRVPFSERGEPLHFALDLITELHQFPVWLWQNDRILVRLPAHHALILRPLCLMSKRPSVISCVLIFHRAWLYLRAWFTSSCCRLLIHILSLLFLAESKLEEVCLSRCFKMLPERLQVKSAQLINLSEKLLKLFLLKQDWVHLVLNVITAHIKGNEKFFVLTEQVVEYARDKVLIRDVLEAELEPIADILVLHAKVWVELLAALVLSLLCHGHSCLAFESRL